MKLLVLLCILPAVFCAPADSQKRFIQTFGIDLNSIFQVDQLKCDVQLMLDALGRDPTEKACESECLTLLQQGHVLTSGCPLVCHGFQNLVHLWHVVPDNATDPAASKCHNQFSHLYTTTVPTTTAS